MRCTILIILFQLLGSAMLQGQPSFQDCTGALPICQPIYSTNEYIEGNGNITEINDDQNPCQLNESNATWYYFTPQTNGLVGFLITPNDPNDDYDWGVYNITNYNCNNLNNAAALVSCNTAGSTSFDPGCNGPTGCTGATSSTTADPGCASGNSPFNALIPVQANNTYVLLLNNWTGSTNGYTIDFSASTATIYDITAPVITDTVALICPNRNYIQLNCNEKIKVNTITATGSEFYITGPSSINIISAANGDAAQPNYTDKINLYFSSITISGNYWLHWRNGTDGNTFSDPCDNFVPYDSMLLEVLPQFVVTLIKDKEELCDGGVITINNTTDVPAIYNINDYSWLDNGTLISTNQNLGTINLSSGSHTIELQINTQQCGVFKSSTTVQVWDYPRFDLPEAYVICPDYTHQLTAFADFAFVTYNWNNGDSNSITSYTSQYPYATCVTEIFGCKWTDTMMIYNNCNFQIPNAFTPNGDGLNDYFYPIVDNDISGVFRIYSRWGEKVFETEDLKQGWDGTFKNSPCNTGVFVYYLYLYNIANSTDIIKGNVTLLR